MFDELVIYLAVQGQVAPYYAFSGTGLFAELLSGVVPTKLASPRGTTTQWNPNIQGIVRIASQPSGQTNPL